MKLTLRSTLVFYLAGLQLIAFAAIIIPSYVTSERTLLHHARTIMRDVAANTIEHSTRFLAPAEAAAELSRRLAEIDIVASDDPAALEKLLFEQLQLAPQFAGIFYGDETGSFVYVMRAEAGAAGPFRSKIIRRDADAKSTELKWRDRYFNLVGSAADEDDAYDPRTRPWYADAKADREVVWTEPYIFYSSRNPGITVAAPVADGAGQVKGVVGVDIEIGAISTFLANLNIAEHGVALIMNRNGDVIAHPREEIIKVEQGAASSGLRFADITEIDDPAARSAFASKLKGGELRIDAGGADMIQSGAFMHDGEAYVSTIAAMKNERHPWIIGVFAPEYDFIGAIKQDRNRSILTAVGIVLATAAIGWLLANRIHRPVKALADRATRISRGRAAPPRPNPASFQELERAGAAFNRMSVWLDKQKRQNAKLNEDLRAASLALEERVSERTAELAAVNERLHQEIAVRAQAEQTLQDEAATHRRTSERLGEAMDKVREANAAKSRFLSSMSHELRSPLNAILGFTELLQTRGDTLSAEKREGYLEHVMSSSEHLLALVNDILDLESIETGTLLMTIEDVDPYAAISDARNEVMALAQSRGVRLVEDLPSEPLPTLSTDAKRLRQVLVNLLSNAIKYSEAGGTVTVSALRRADRLRISVVDEGVGIAEDLHDRIFTPFDRLGAEASDVEGAGVGLALAKQLVENMGGRIGFESSRGLGSLFWVEVPARENASDQNAEADDARPKTEHHFDGVKRLLYIDDNFLNLKLISDFLNSRRDVVVISASTAEAGLELATSERFDLIIVDINLPDMSGFDLLKKLREAHGDTIILALSADAMPQQIARGLKAGFDGYVTKPVKLHILEREIETRLSDTA